MNDEHTNDGRPLPELPASAYEPDATPLEAVYETVPTQIVRPWRATIRTAFAVIVALAFGAPLIYIAVTQSEPGAATGAAATVLAVAGAITRVLALPWTEAFLRRFVPWLAADSDD